MGYVLDEIWSLPGSVEAPPRRPPRIQRILSDDRWNLSFSIELFKAGDLDAICWDEMDEIHGGTEQFVGFHGILG